VFLECIRNLIRSAAQRPQQSLLCIRTGPGTPFQARKSAEHGLQYALDDYGIIKCINYIRRAVADGADPLPQLQQGPAVFDDDKYLQPVRDDDALLFHDFLPAQPGGPTLADAHADTSVEQLQAENEALRHALQQLRVEVRSRSRRMRAFCRPKFVLRTQSTLNIAPLCRRYPWSCKTIGSKQRKSLWEKQALRAFPTEKHTCRVAKQCR
jgi:hypothetical protein